MKNKKGFTLVEIMGVMTILALLLIVTVPAIVNSIKKSDIDEIARIEKDIFLATEVYVQKNEIEVPEGLTEGAPCVPIQDLIKDEYVRYDNIKTIDDIKSKCVRVTKENLEYKYELVDNNA